MVIRVARATFDKYYPVVKYYVEKYVGMPCDRSFIICFVISRVYSTLYRMQHHQLFRFRFIVNRLMDIETESIISIRLRRAYSGHIRAAITGLSSMLGISKSVIPTFCIILFGIGVSRETSISRDGESFEFTDGGVSIGEGDG